LSTFNQSELYQINQHSEEAKRNFQVILKFIDDDLRAQFQTCISASKTDTERAACVSPVQREEQYGLYVREKKPKMSKPSTDPPHQ
jgi:hypothetical protein